MEFQTALDKSMKKINKKDEKFRKQVLRASTRPKRIGRDSFIRNLERIDKSLKRRKISTSVAMEQLRKLID